MNKPKILMCNRPVSQRQAHGDWVQLLNTREALIALGYTVDIAESNPNLAEYDIIHLFNLNQLSETYRLYLDAKRLQKKIVLSTIWIPIPETQKFYGHRLGFKSFPIWTYLGGREFYYAWKNKTLPCWKAILFFRKTVKEIIAGVNCLLPNSDLELAALQRDIEVTGNLKYTTIPNAVNISTAQIAAKKKMIVCAGHIGPAKNQIALCQAFLQLVQDYPEYSLVFIGQANAAYAKYFKQFEKLIDNQNIFYRGRIAHEEALKLYAEAEICVLPSFFETTGLSALEALAANAKIVITECGYTRAYFKEYAQYCNPYAIASIRNALAAALVQKTPVLPKDFFTALTWQATAIKTAEVYEKLMSQL